MKNYYEGQIKHVLFIPIFFFLGIMSSLGQDVLVLKQENAPLIIYEFTAKYQDGASRYASEGIRFDVRFTNITEQPVVAYSIGFFAFDVFNRPLGRPFGGFAIEAIDPNGSERGAWVQRTTSSALFREYGTGVAYVSKVRFEDGTIWSYDSESILNQLQEFEATLTIDDLESD